MDTYRAVISIARTNFCRWKNDRRIWLIFIFIGMLLYHDLNGLTEYGLETGETCTIYLLPLLFAGELISVGSTKMILYMGALFLLCDAPFIYPITPYMVIRSKRNSWWLGECFYIILTSVLYIAFITLIAGVIVLPIAETGDSWGTVIRHMFFGKSGMSSVHLRSLYDVHISNAKNTIGYLYPLGAQIYTFFTAWGSFVVLALIQYWVSLKSKSMFWGFASASAFVF